MKELGELPLKLPVQPLYIQFFVYLVLLSLFTDVVGAVIFSNNITFEAKFFGIIYFGLAMTLTTTFSYRKSYIFRKKDRAQLEYWVEFQKVIATGEPLKNSSADNAIDSLAKIYIKQNKRKLLYGPSILLVGGFSSMLLAYMSSQSFWLFFGIVFISFGIGLLIEAKHKISNARKIIDK